MIVFLDFEASSLSKRSFPVEVAWVFEDGRSQTFLIKSAQDWDDWSLEAEAIHGITRSMLETEGTPIQDVTREMIEQLSGHRLFASAPSWDGKWLSTLLRAGGYPRHSLRLRKSDEIFREIAASLLCLAPDHTTTVTLVEEAIRKTEAAPPAHRALPDAQLELSRLELVRRMAVEI